MGAWPSSSQPRRLAVASSFEHLRDFIRSRMRMSHIYQPVMIKELLQSGGRASIRNIAAAFLSRDESQLEYYEQITKDMPGKVLGRHGIVERNGEEYRLIIDPSLSSEERNEQWWARLLYHDLLQRPTAIVSYCFELSVSRMSIAIGSAMPPPRRTLPGLG